MNNEDDANLIQRTHAPEPVMGTPLEVVRLLDEAFCSGDVDAILSYYEDGATMVVQPGTLATGKPELRRAFENIFRLFGSPPVVTQEKTSIIESGDIALFTSKWSLTGATASGPEISREGYSSAVFRKQPDSNWKVVVDNSWGPAVLDCKA
jgi:ketosteroid isomerase-like protein